MITDCRSNIGTERKRTQNTVKTKLRIKGLLVPDLPPYMTLLTELNSLSLDFFYIFEVNHDREWF